MSARSPRRHPARRSCIPLLLIAALSTLPAPARGEQEIGLQAELIGAVVGLDKCSGAFVGDYGLIATSYDCARQALESGGVAAASMREGFVAATWGEELAAPGLRARVLHGTPGMPASWIEISDVRLAYAPAEAIADFGGRGEEAGWPRHAAGFALLRAWTVNEEGKPVPYRPQHHLALHARGVRPGDMVRVLGLAGHDGAASPPAAGRVKGYSPADAVWMEPQATLSGLLQKVTGQPPFALPDSLLQAARQPQQGRWRQAGLGSVPTCFLADMAGRDEKSGSPVVNEQGRLVGIRIGRVFAARAAAGPDIPGPSRAVLVDVRYLLWLLEQVDGAWSIMREMGVRPEPPQPEAGP